MVCVSSSDRNLCENNRYEAVFLSADACRAKYALLLFTFAVNELGIVYATCMCGSVNPGGLGLGRPRAAWMRVRWPYGN